MWIIQEFFYAVLMPANDIVSSLDGPVCIQNNYFLFLVSLCAKKDGT